MVEEGGEGGTRGTQCCNIVVACSMVAHACSLRRQVAAASLATPLILRPSSAGSQLAGSRKRPKGSEHNFGVFLLIISLPFWPSTSPRLVYNLSAALATVLRGCN